MEKYSDIKVVFDYNIICDDNIIYESSVLAEVTGKELQQIAEFFEGNSGHPVEFDSLPIKFRNKVHSAASEDFEKAKNIGEDDFIDYWTDINNILPPKLIHAIEQVLGCKRISVKYSVNIGRRIFRDTAKINISTEEFYNLAGYQLELHTGYTFFEWLKERDNELCCKLETLVKKWAEDKFAPDGKTQIEVEDLKNCPTEISQYIDCPDYSFWEF